MSGATTGDAAAGAAGARKGYVQVYTGDGKGKTTAGFGLAMRAAGRGLRVLILQFMKADPTWGEIVSAGRLGIPVEQVGLDHWVRVGKVTPDDLRAAAAGFARARDLVVSGDYDLVVLDELVTALFFELVPLADVLALLAAKPAHTELLLTGRRAPTSSSRPPTWSARCGRSSTTSTPAWTRARASSTDRGRRAANRDRSHAAEVLT